MPSYLRLARPFSTVCRDFRMPHDWRFPPLGPADLASARPENPSLFEQASQLVASHERATPFFVPGDATPAAINSCKVSVSWLTGRAGRRGNTRLAGFRRPPADARRGKPGHPPRDDIDGLHRQPNVPI
jgi:hypothetical protein